MYKHIKKGFYIMRKLKNAVTNEKIYITIGVWQRYLVVKCPQPDFPSRLVKKPSYFYQK